MSVSLLPWIGLLFGTGLITVKANGFGYDDFDGYGDMPFDPYDGYGGGGGYGAANEPPFEDLLTLEELNDFVNYTSDVTEVGGGTVAIFNLPEMDASEQFDEENEPQIFKDVGVYLDVSRELGTTGFRFAISRSQELIGRFNVKTWKIYTFLPKTYVGMGAKDEKEKKRFSGSGSLDSVSLKSFIVENSFPVVGQLTQSTEHSVLLTNKPVFFVYSRVSAKTELKWTTYLANRIKTVAQQNQNAIFTLLNKAEGHLMNLFLIDLLETDREKFIKTDFILVGCRDPVTRTMFKAKKEFNQENVQQFVDLVLNYQSDDLNKELFDEVVEVLDVDFNAQEGNFEKNLDEDEAEELDDTYVAEVTGMALEGLLGDLEMDMLIEFYAPWCGYCQQFKSRYAQIAERLAKSHPGLIVAKINADEEEIPSMFKVDGFPTLYFVKHPSPLSATPKPILFQGSLEIQDVIDFVVMNSDKNQVKRDEL